MRQRYNWVVCIMAAMLLFLMGLGTAGAYDMYVDPYDTYGMGEVGTSEGESFYDSAMQEMQDQVDQSYYMDQITTPDNTRRWHSNYCDQIAGNDAAQSSCYDSIW